MWDFHTYPAAEWFVGAEGVDLFDPGRYPREWPKVFVSEYGAQCPSEARGGGASCETGTLYNAVMEAAWMVRAQDDPL
eukprot:847627-Prorocentrum_minimum.AAC.1